MYYKEQFINVYFQQALFLMFKGKNIFCLISLSNDLGENFNWNVHIKKHCINFIEVESNEPTAQGTSELVRDTLRLYHWWSVFHLGEVEYRLLE